MKKKISILLVVCLLLQVIGVSAFATESADLDLEQEAVIEENVEAAEQEIIEAEPENQEEAASQVQEEVTKSEKTEELASEQETVEEPIPEKVENDELESDVEAANEVKEASTGDEEIEEKNEETPEVKEETDKEELEHSEVEGDVPANEELPAEELVENEDEFEACLIILSEGNSVYTTKSCAKDDSFELAANAVLYAFEKEGNLYKVAYAFDNAEKTGYVKADEALKIENAAEYEQANADNQVEISGYYLPNISVKVEVLQEEENLSVEEKADSETVYSEENEAEATAEEETQVEAVAEEEAEIAIEEEQGVEILEVEEKEIVVEEITEEVEEIIEEAEAAEEVVETVEVAEEAEKDEEKDEEASDVEEVVELDALNSAVPISTKYTIDPVTGYITECVSEDTVIIIPDTVLDANGNPVTVLGITETAFARNTSITSVLLNNALSLTYLAKGCFQGCTALTSFSFNNKVTTIDADMFRGCTSLSTITWPTLLTSIGTNAFENCTSLTGLTLPASVTTIDNAAFQGCTSLQDLYLQNGLTTIGSNAFNGCSSLKAIYIPDTVTTVGNSAFENCSNASVLSLSNSMTEVNNFSFSGCTGLTEVIIPNSVTTIGREAFHNCNGVKRVEIPSATRTIGSNAFSGINSDAIVLVETTNAVIGTDAFGNDCTIFGYIGSTTEAYANSHEGIKFYPLDIVNFVKQAYNGILGRGVDEDALYNFSIKLARREMTASEFINTLLTSKEYSNRGFLYNYPSAINAAYQGMLGRGPSSQELSDGQTMMQNGVSICFIANIISQSAEYNINCNNIRVTPGTIPIVENRDKRYDTTKFVARCYNILLNPIPSGSRTFDVDGMNYWTGRLLDGTMTGASMVIGFVRSDEYNNMGQSDSDRITNIYRTMLDRYPDSAGMSTWQNLLNDGCSIESVVAGFAGTPEFRYMCGIYGIIPGAVTATQPRDRNREVTKFVKSCYTAALGRTTVPPYDVNGMNNWTLAIVTKSLTPAQVAYGFVFSDECLMRNLNNTQFVNMLYNLYLGRSMYTDSGWVNWKNALDGGMPRTTLVQTFSETLEFRNRVAFFYSL